VATQWTKELNGLKKFFQLEQQENLLKKTITKQVLCIKKPTDKTIRIGNQDGE
jgi:hypothetical protein